MRIFATIAGTLLTLVSVGATTLQQLSTDEMIQQSTSILRAKVTASSVAARGRDIYTYYQFQVLETIKPSSTQMPQVAVPGGAVAGLRQIVPGAPALSIGQEFVIFLWTSRSGLTQIIGLSQGLFNVMQDSAGNAILVRPAATGLVIDKAGDVVQGATATMKLSDLRTEVLKVLGSGK